MRKVTESIVGAFLNREPKANGNTRTYGYGLFLFGNLIAEWRGMDLWISTGGGWPSSTTKDRLNALPGVRCYSVKRQLYLNGKQWDGQWTKI